MSNVDRFSVLSEFFKALSDPTRIEILEILKTGEQNFKSIRDIIDRSPSILSNHLKILIDHDFLNVRTEGASKYYTVKNPEIYSILHSVDSFENTNRLKKILELSRSESNELLR